MPGKRLAFGLAAAVALWLRASGQELDESRNFVRKRQLAFHAGRLSADQPGGAAARLNAIEEANRLRPLPEFDGIWHSIGPRPTIVLDTATSGGPPIASGRVTSIAADRRNGDVAYIGAAHGGVWKTEDAGRTWTPLTDQQPTLAIGSLAIDPSHPDTVYAGTGEENFDKVENYFGAGILKSEDAGKTWKLLASEEFGGPVSARSGGARIGAIAVHPKDGRILLAAVQGRKGEQSGIYRSDDAGVTWRNVLSGAPGCSVVIDPAEPSTVYAALGGVGPFAAAGIYKSVDGGLTWRRAGGGIPSKTGRVTLTISQSNPSVLYAAIANTKDPDAPLGVFKTTDGAVTWTSAGAPDYCSGSCYWANTIQVSPDNPDLVLVAGLQVYMTRDGGKTWVQVSQGANGNYIHWDVHAIVFGPQGNRVWVGTDGGVYRADEIRDARIRDLGWDNVNDTLAITQFYPGCSGQLRQTDFIICGTQDNGVQIYTGGSTWRMIGGGDGGFTAMDSSRPSIFYFSAAGAVSVYKSSPFTSFKGLLPVNSGLEKVDADDCFLQPLALDPAFPQRLYYGCRSVYRSNDGGGNWQEISPKLSPGAAITFLAVAPANSSRVYAATSAGKVRVTDNATAATAVTWRDSNDLPARGISSVVVDAKNPDIAYATALGFSGFGDRLGHVFRTTDGGRTWRDISGNLPNIPVNTVLPEAEQGGALFVGTDIGVFRTHDGGATWSTVGIGLPRVPVMHLRLHADGRILRAATHGRGMWEMPVPYPMLATAPFRLDSARVVARSARLTGAGFTAATVARWNGQERPTTLVNETTVDAALTPADLASLVRATVTVRDRNTGRVSNTVDAETNAAPVITRLDNGAVSGPAAAAALQPCPSNAATLAAGMVATVRGQNLAATTARMAESSLGQTLGGAVVEFRSTSAHESFIAPLLFVSPARIDFLVPEDVPLGSGLQFDVVQGTRMSQKVCVTIGKFSPGLFSTNGTGGGQGSVTCASDGKLAAAAGNNARAAKKGELVRILATGLGPYWREPGKQPLSTIAVPTAQIGGQPAEVAASEAQRPFTGKYVVTVRIPAGAPSGPAVPIQLTAGGLKSNIVTIAVE